MGNALGLRVGTALGGTDGTKLGFMLGVSEGVRDGASVGTADGLTLGCRVGLCVGLREGCSDGACDGSELGCSVGIKLDVWVWVFAWCLHSAAYVAACAMPFFEHAAVSPQVRVDCDHSQPFPTGCISQCARQLWGLVAFQGLRGTSSHLDPQLIPCLSRSHRRPADTLSLEGFSVGTTDGATLGMSVGDTVGAAVGRSDGCCDGMCVGARVGVTVGAIDGAAVGKRVGNFDGSCVGRGRDAGLDGAAEPRIRCSV